MSERVSRVVLTESCAPRSADILRVRRHVSRVPSGDIARLARPLRRALRGAAPQRERSQVREVFVVLWRATTIRFPDRIRCTMSACGEARPR
jgi:hypothetical protein